VPHYDLINLPTNYYGVAFSIARLRMMMGWEDDSAGKVLLDKMLTHYKKYSGKPIGFSDETDGEGRFDRYSILLIAEICERFLETGLQPTPELKGLLRKAADIALNVSNTAGEGFSFGRSLGPYGETALVEILSVSAYLGVLTPEEKQYAYAFSSRVAARYMDFWYDPAMHSVDMWGKGRRTDTYRGKHRILGENFSLLHQLISTNEMWNKAGMKDVQPKADLQAWLDKTRPQFSTTTFAKGEYDRALAIFRDGKAHVVSLNMINGGGSQHDNSPYYPLPFAPGIIAGVADSGGAHPQLLPKFTHGRWRAADRRRVDQGHQDRQGWPALRRHAIARMNWTAWAKKARSRMAASSWKPPTRPLQNIYGRSHLSLNGRWSYIIDPYETGYYDYRHVPFDASASGKGGFYDDRKPKDKSDWVEYDFDRAPTMKIPGDWNSQAEKLQLYEGTLWLRQVFEAQPVQGKHYMLYFGAVNYEAHVYLNGKKLGMHRGGFTPFQFDVTGQAAQGPQHGRRQGRQHAPPGRHPDPEHGLVELRRHHPRRAAGRTAGHLHRRLQAAAGEGRRPSHRGLCADGGRRRAQKVTVSIPEAGIQASVQTDANGRAAVSIPVPIGWTCGRPSIRSCTRWTLAAGDDKVSDRIGFRTIETRGEDILLNGKSVFLRGISLHDENPLIPGRLRGSGDMRMLLQWAKDMNCNYVRLAHYPHSEEMIRLADEMGLMVWAEVPVYWTISWDKPETYANAKAQLTDLIVRDKNRASVVVWSIGNETPISAPRNAFMGGWRRPRARSTTRAWSRPRWKSTARARRSRSKIRWPTSSTWPASTNTPAGTGPAMPRCWTSASTSS
jgi:hypothetical protein